MKELYKISNSDGTLRWVWPIDSTEPHFLKFYIANTWKQKVIKVVFNMIFKLKLQNMAFKKTAFDGKNDLPKHSNWALFYGTPGPNNKRILFFKDEANMGVFRKIGNGKQSFQRIEKEKETLNYLEQEDLGFSVPKLKNDEIGQIDISGVPNCESSSSWTTKHTDFIKDSGSICAEYKTVGTWSSWFKICKRISKLSEVERGRIPQNLIDKLILLKSQVNREQKFNFQFSHGDFTPWNSFSTCDGKLGVIDWEMSNSDGVFGSDFFHYHVQNGILVSNKTSLEIVKEIIEIGLNERLFESKKELLQHFGLYMLDHVSYYADLYNEQEKWHIQIRWQLEAWLELMNELIEIWSDRKLFIGDLVNELKDKNYAGLKLKHQRPEDLSEYSDLDLIISKKEVKPIIQWVKKRGSVERVYVLSQSFMKSLTIQFKDGTRLHLDLITKFKRKSKTYLDIDVFLENAAPNEFGVKECSVQDTGLFISMFYGLNNSFIPAHFKKKYDCFVPFKNDSERTAHKHFNDDVESIQTLKKSVTDRPENKGLMGLFSKLVYAIDVLRKYTQRNGMIITFSGVDGAGKTTIINEIRREIDKKYRKPVVVLRHRPSIIPILSAFKYGKEEAEKRSVEKLPRQGQNTSKAKSLLRFAYYYTDYFFGQFYVHVKYVMRGHVVIYDRYYFDMINDGKRSNITLPKFVTKAGYYFLLKPRYNFFLYASSETILERKKELDVQTIQQLNKTYKKLFARLQKRSRQLQYVSINNQVLKDTKTKIFQTIGQL